MADLHDTWTGLWEKLKGASAQRIRSIPIPPARIAGSDFHDVRLQRGEHYFAVIINEMFLAKARQWWNLYDPMAIVVSEFTYSGKRTVVPYVVGPAMLENKIQEIPRGMAITDTQVAGLHPYAGGRLALTVILAQVKRDSYARRLLNMVENVSAAFPIGPALTPHLKVASAIVEGVESLFSMGDTQALIGHRWELNDDFTPWLNPGFFALINSDEKNMDTENLFVVNGQLRCGPDESAQTFAVNDYVLYSLCASTERTDVTELPMYSAFEVALKTAASLEPGAWDKAKANLVTLYQDLLTSPDLTWNQAQQLTDSFKQKLVHAHEKVKSYGELGSNVLSEQPRRALLGLEGFVGAEREERASRLMEIHELLRLQ